jgi:murein DD-endopeptidase MepM/ murein hydrolase activator NlpD
MPRFILPVGAARVSPNGTWSGHRARKPPSVNPGTDYEVPRGTAVRAAHGGRVVHAQSTYAGSGGRLVYLRSLDGGRSTETQYLHLDRVDVRIGQVVNQGDILGLSGASGFGKTNYYGPHTHVTLLLDGRNVDFAANFAASASLDSTPIGNDMPTLDQPALLSILTAGGEVPGHGGVSLFDAMKATYFYGDRAEARHVEILDAIRGLPAATWAHPLPHMLMPDETVPGGYQMVSAGSFLSYDPAEHENTRKAAAAGLSALSVDGLDEEKLAEILKATAFDPEKIAAQVLAAFDEAETAAIAARAKAKDNITHLRLVDAPKGTIEQDASSPAA